MNIPELRFDMIDAQRAFDDWGANCGPGAIAAITGMSLADLRPHMGDFEQKHYTNPRLMFQILNELGINWKKSTLEKIPTFGLVRVQWDGPWMEKSWPHRQRHTHWIATCWPVEQLEPGIFDINAIAMGGWIPMSTWSGWLVPWIIERCEPEASGDFSYTHCLEITL